MSDTPGEPIATPATELGPGERATSTGSPTRGFLFADLREYTRYLESHGAADAADLLVRYRSLVRDAVGRWDGAEIKTEGDSFYVVFPAVSAALQCGLAIVGAAAGRADGVDAGQTPIPVGIGIHAGETVETPDGYVGSAVNIAARICALARPGEVLVSDTVRALTQSIVPVSFTSRGRRALKGLTEPVAVFAVAGTGDVWATPRRRWASRRRPLVAGALVVSVVLVVGLFAWNQGRSAAGLPPGTWTIGVDLPLTGGGAYVGNPIRDAVQLSIDQVNAKGGVAGRQLKLDVHDDADDPDQGAANVSAMVADPRTIAMIGPSRSVVAMSEIPITNRAGLLQCGSGTTYPQLTRPQFALEFRKDRPDRINFVRTSNTDDVMATAIASFVFRDRKITSTLVVDGMDFDHIIGAEFSEAYTKLGGTVVSRGFNAGATPAQVLAPLSETDPPGAVFFGGWTDTGGPELRLGMMDAGHADIPFLGYGGGVLQDGSGADPKSFIGRIGAGAAANTYVATTTIGLPTVAFDEAFRERYGHLPEDGLEVEKIGYPAAGYACAQIVFDALQAVAATGPSAEGLREAVRAYVLDPSHRYETVIGTFGFDKNGDSTRQFAGIYQVDPAAVGGLGDWALMKQQDYGPAP